MKLVKRSKPQHWLGKGLYAQMKETNRLKYETLNYEDLKDAIGEMFYGKQK